MKNIKYVVDNSKYVKIDYQKLNEFANLICENDYNHWSKELNLNLTEKQWILLCFIIESMNFCFWLPPKWKIEYKNELLNGSNALFYSIIKEVENNSSFLTIDYLINLRREDLERIFHPVEGEIPLFEERYLNFVETIQVISSNKNFFNDLFNIKKDTELLNYIVANFKSFDDKSDYKDRVIHFNKRATLLTNDLFCISKTINKNIKNVDNLLGCADYGIPRTFRDYGILVYNQELSDLIDGKKEILHDSEMEVEIRANMLYALNEIKNILETKNKFINTVELDNVIWLFGRKKHSLPHHRSITIYY